MEPASDIKKQILREYNRDSSDWHVFTTRDSRGYVNTIFVHGREVWFLKEHLVNPFESIGLGLRSAADQLRFGRPPYTFGFRPVDNRTIEQILHKESSGQSVDDLLKTLLRQNPTPLDKIQSPLAVGGPVLLSHPAKLDIFPHQRDLDMKLRLELDRLLMGRYPHLFSMYR